MRPVAVEAGVVAWLAGRLPAVHVGTRVPERRPPRFVRVGRTGGERLNLALERPVILVECWLRIRSRQNSSRQTRGPRWTRWPTPGLGGRIAST